MGKFLVVKDPVVSERYPFILCIPKYDETIYITGIALSHFKRGKAREYWSDYSWTMEKHLSIKEFLSIKSQIPEFEGTFEECVAYINMMELLGE